MTETMTLSITPHPREVAAGRAGAPRLSDRGGRLWDATPAHPADIKHGFPGAREPDDRLAGAREPVGLGDDRLAGAREVVGHMLPGARELEMVWQMSEEPEGADTV